MNPIKITVTQEDIDEGRPANCSWCPLANALRRHFPNSDCVSVGGKAEAWVRLDHIHAFKLSPDAIQFVRNFDGAPTRHLCVPSTFELIPT